MYRCRLCDHSELTLFLDLGFTPLADQFKRKEQLLEPEIYYPLEVVQCNRCHFVQLNHVVSPEVLYRNDYPYESSMTATGQKHFYEFAQTVTDLFHLSSKDLAIDIGSNVGVLLKGFQNCGVSVLGIDPAPNIVRIAEQNGVPSLAEFFNEDTAKSVLASHGPASVLTGSNVFAHIDDLNAFMRAVNTLLAPNGVLVIEAPHWGTLLENLEYDTIYHEHLSYLSLTPLVPFFKKCGFEPIRIQQVDIHGGSFRMFIARIGAHAPDSSVQTFLAKEAAENIHDIDRLHAFAKKVKANRDQLTWLLRKLKHEGKKIAALSAPAKGMTLLNYCKIGKETLEFATEKSKLKIGRFTPGGHLPVLSDSQLLEQDIDYALLLAWNFKKEIIQNLKTFQDKGGKFIIPIPEPTIV